jgi:hypothetical protein
MERQRRRKALMWLNLWQKKARRYEFSMVTLSSQEVLVFVDSCNRYNVPNWHTAVPKNLAVSGGLYFRRNVFCALVF